MKIILIFIFTTLFDLSYSEEVNIFTTRHYESDFELYSKFTKETGIKVNIVSGKSKPLEKRIIEESDNCIGDIFILADAGRLMSAEKKGLFKSIEENYFKTVIPENFRTKYWFAITKRARILFYNPAYTNINELSGIDYEDLASPKWRNSIAIRQSNNVYNQSLVASLIKINGLDSTKEWANKVVKNFVREPQGNDRSQILAVASGNAKIAVANTYYYALMLSGQKGDEQKFAATKVKPFFPNQNNRGVHMNISGAGILKNAPNTKNAVTFLKFLLTQDAQSHIVNNTFEFPIIENVEPNDLVKNMGKFKQDLKTPVSSYGKLQKESFKLMKDAGWK